jgi:ATP-dependent RNA helicase DeaD
VDVDVIAGKLSDRGYDTDGLHGDISQPQREAILRKFKSRKINILVATDVAARGIDVQDLTHVINYALPQDPESYVHRIGRTGRAGKEGTAITFITPEEYRKLLFIKKITKTSIRKEKLPGIKEIIESKKSIIQNEINEILESGDFDQYVGFAQELISENEPEKVLAALLKHAFKEELDQKYYHEIRDISVNRKGRTRLFIAKGKMDNMDAKKIAHLIQSESKIDPRKLQDIRVFEKFSFVTFKRIKRGRRPVVERAKEK